MSKYKIPEMREYDDEHSFLNSIHKVLVAHKVIPKNVGVVEMTKDFGIGLRNDELIDSDYIQELGTKMNISHSVDGKEKKILERLNIFTLERDCNHYYEIDGYMTGGNLSVVLMKEGAFYKPVLQNNDQRGSSKGLYKMEDGVVEYLMENGDLHKSVTKKKGKK